MPHTPDDDIDDFDGRPSKSERKRNAHEAQALGEELVKLKDLDLKAFELPESLYDAIVEARRLTSRAALVRQRQLIGKLMRGMQLEPIRTALASRGQEAARETQRFKKVEHWRDRLIAEGAPALDELMKVRPGMDRDEWLARVAAAAAERQKLGTTGAKSRELFRHLRALLDRVVPTPGSS
jgi:ribosome-associated protein